MKVIQILAHSPSWITKNIEEDIYDGWQVRTAKAIQKLTNEFEFECFLPEKTFRKISQDTRAGINYKIFPSTAFTYGREISFPLFNEIGKLKKGKVILHIHGLHNYLTYVLCQIFQTTPIVIQHHGDCPPVNLIERRKILIPLLPILGLEQLMMNCSLRFADQFFVLTEREKTALLKIVSPEKVSVQGMGVDFNHFKPTDKEEARRQLNLRFADGSKILLYVGKLLKYKGCDVIIDSFQELKTRYNIQLLVVGSSSADPLYAEAKAKGATIICRQPQEKMPLYYNAADITLLPITKALKWRGVGVSIVESLACDTPVVAGNLKNFPWQVEKIGFFGATKKQVVEGVEFIIRNPARFQDCRAEAMRYFDWSIIAGNTITVYNKLAKNYYGNNFLKP